MAYWIEEGSLSDPAAFRQTVEQSKQRFFFDRGSPPDSPNAAWSENALAEANALRQGCFTYFSKQVGELGFPEPDWLFNPFTGQRENGNGRHWCDSQDFEEDRGDIKFLWEPSRFCWVYALVRAYGSTRKEEYAETFWTLFESWMRANPPQIGIHWQCGQEIAIRVCACVFATHAFWNSPSTTDDRVAAMTVFLSASAERIARNIAYAQAQMGNHATSEAAGLLSVAVLFPWLRGAEEWLDIARDTLEDEVLHFNWEDGSYTQHSMNYQRLMLHAYLWSIRLGALNGLAFSDLVMERIRRSYEFMVQLQDEVSGRVPNYGPNDGALMLPLHACDYLDYRPVLGSLHYLFHQKLLYPEGSWMEDLVWIFGPEALRKELCEIERKSSGFPHGGYYTLRSDETWAMVRCHSYKSRPNQADMLHCDLWWKGLNVLRDSGTYTYFDPVDHWNTYFVSTSAHNTVELGGLDQMIKGPRFRWYSLVRSCCRWHTHHAHLEYWQGEHYGYQRLPSQAIHRRAIYRDGRLIWVVVDDVVGTGKEAVALYWQLLDAPYKVTDQHACFQTEEGPVHLTTLSNQPIQFDVVHGQEGDAKAGWDSLYYGMRSATPSIVVRSEAELPLG